MTIRGIIFDFDGLICDTESTELLAWEWLFEKYEVPFPIQKYQESIGSVFDDQTPFVVLKDAVGPDFDAEKANKLYRQYHNELIQVEPLMPGVLEYLEYAWETGLSIGLASSSPLSWIEQHLKRLEIIHFFASIKTRDDVKHTKPDPELFLTSLASLNLQSNETISLEDSPNGMIASKAAGLITAAVPNLVTKILTINNADMALNSLLDIPLADLIKRFS